MSHYVELLALARAQIASAETGDVMKAIGMLDARQNLLASAPAPTVQEEAMLREILELDRKLSGFIRERMIAIRLESLTLQRGQSAMRGYRPLRDHAGVRFDYAR